MKKSKKVVFLVACFLSEALLLLYRVVYTRGYNKGYKDGFESECDCKEAIEHLNATLKAMDEDCNNSN